MMAGHPSFCGHMVGHLYMTTDEILAMPEYMDISETHEKKLKTNLFRCKHFLKSM